MHTSSNKIVWYETEKIHWHWYPHVYILCNPQCCHCTNNKNKCLQYFCTILMTLVFLIWSGCISVMHDYLVCIALQLCKETCDFEGAV